MKSIYVLFATGILSAGPTLGACDFPSDGVPGVDFPQPGHAVGNGVSVHPWLKEMQIVNPESGIDYPTGLPLPKNVKILALAENNRIKIFTTNAALKTPIAGIDYPTDSTQPYWTCYAKVLVLKKTARVPVTLGKIDQRLFWNLRSGISLDVTEIQDIRSIKGRFYILEKNGTRHRLW